MTRLESRSSWKVVLDFAAALSMIAASVVFIALALSLRGSVERRPSRPAARATAESRLPDHPLSLNNAALRGQLDAPVVVIQYSDFQCPYCAKFAQETLPRVVKAYVDKGKLLIAFRHLPLEAIHAEAAKAAEAAECGGLQGKFWEMHDALFRDVRQLDARTHAARASELGLDVPQFSECLQGDRATRVQADLADARQLGIARTPTFLFGTPRADGTVTIVQRESGALPCQLLSGIVEKLLAASKTASR